MLTRKKVQTSILLIAGIILLFNFIANKFYFRLDYTEDQRYSLSDDGMQLTVELFLQPKFFGA